MIYVDLATMAGVASTCEDCEGKRFQASVLEHRLAGRDIAEVLAMSVSEAAEFFAAGEARTPGAQAILERLVEVGLGYVSLGQPLTTLSGGERQRLKLATHLGAKGGVYVLDEPTTGLHLADVDQLLGLLDRRVDAGKSVIVVEHHLAVMAHADWIIDLGSGAGHDGGRSSSRAHPPTSSPPAPPSPRAPGGLRRRQTGAVEKGFALHADARRGHRCPRARLHSAADPDLGDVPERRARSGHRKGRPDALPALYRPKTWE